MTSPQQTHSDICYIRRFARRSIIAILSLLLFISSFSNQAHANPLKEVINSRNYRKVLGSPNKRVSAEKVYSKKWLNPGSFFGQLFMRDDGYMLLFEWLSIPVLKYSPVTTTIRRKPEYIEVIRTYLDDHAKSIAISILIPHPRSREVVDQGLIKAFTKRVPTQAEIHKQTEILAGEKKGMSYVWEDNQCSVVYKGAESSLIEARVESCRQQKNLEDFFKVLNLALFDQRLQS